MKILSILTLFFDCLSTLSIFTLSLHDALPIYVFFDGLLLLLLYANGFAQELDTGQSRSQVVMHIRGDSRSFFFDRDRKSTRLNSSHVEISYAVFCLKKKKAERKQRDEIETRNS